MKLKLAAVAALGLLSACVTVPPQNFDGNAVRGARRPAPIIAPAPPEPVVQPEPRPLTKEMVQSDLPPPPLEMGLGGGEPLSSLDAPDSNFEMSPITQTTLPE